MKRVLSTLLGAVALSFSVSSLAEGPTTLRFSNFAGPTSFLTTEIFEPLVKNIEDDSDGTLKIKLYSGGSLVKPEDSIEAVRKGLVDMAWSLTGYNPGKFKVGGVTEIPFKAGNVLEGSYGAWSLYDQGLMDGFDGVYVFGLSSSAIGAFHSVKKINSLEDLQGERVRAAGPLISDTVKALGFVPVGIPASQVAENLSKKVINGSVNDWVALETWQIGDLVNYHVDVPLGATTAYVVINQKKFDKLPKKAQEALIKNGGENFVRFWSKKLEDENQRGKKEILSKDNQVLITPTEEQLNSYKDIVQPIIDEWITSIPNGEKVWQVYNEAINQIRSEK